MVEPHDASSSSTQMELSIRPVDLALSASKEPRATRAAGAQEDQQFKIADLRSPSLEGNPLLTSQPPIDLPFARRKSSSAQLAQQSVNSPLLASTHYESQTSSVGHCSSSQDDSHASEGEETCSIVTDEASSMEGTVFHSTHSLAAPSIVSQSLNGEGRSKLLSTAQSLQMTSGPYEAVTVVEHQLEEEAMKAQEDASKQQKQRVYCLQVERENPLQRQDAKILAKNAKSIRMAAMEMSVDSPSEVEGDMKFHDKPFAIAYLVALSFMMVLGLIYSIFARPVAEEYQTGAAYAIYKSTNVLLLMATITAFLAAIWIYFLKHTIKAITWATVFTIPISFFMIAVWNWDRAAKSMEFSTGHFIGGMLSAIGSLLSTFLIYRRKNDVNRSVDLIQLAVEILIDNPSLLGVCLSMMMIQTGFYALWLAMFGRIVITGDLQVDLDSDNHFFRHWVPEPTSRLVIAYFVFMFFWTTCVLSYIERYTSSRVVTQWYFHRTDQLRMYSDAAVSAFRRAISLHFGSIVLAALLLTVVKMAQYVVSLMQRLTNTARNPVMGMLFGCCGVLESLVQGINSFTLVYMAYSDKDFMASSRLCGSLFRRHLLPALFFNLATKLILMASVICLSVLSFVVTYSVSTNYTDTSTAWLIGVMGSIIPFYISRYAFYVLQQVIDSVYVCYIIDLDQGQCHLQRAHDLFGVQKRVLFDSSPDIAV